MAAISQGGWHFWLYREEQFEGSGDRKLKRSCEMSSHFPELGIPARSFHTYGRALQIFSGASSTVGKLVIGIGERCGGGIAREGAITGTFSSHEFQEPFGCINDRLIDTTT